MIDPYKQKFRMHKHNAAARGVEFKLTLDEWKQIWISSGFWEQRGPRRGQYCMSRYGDTGPYEVGNVFIQLTTQNTSDAQKGKIVIISEEHKAKLRVSMLGKNKGRPSKFLGVKRKQKELA